MFGTLRAIGGTVLGSLLLELWNVAVAAACSNGAGWPS